MITIYGAGSVGLVIGARLARAGSRVLFLTRHPEAAREIAEAGVRFEDPGTGEAWSAPAAAAAGVEAAAEHIAEGPVLFCVRASQTEDAARSLARAAPGAAAVSVQNDVDNEEVLARRFPRVLGAVLRQTCTRTESNAAVATGAGRIVLGAHPEGGGPDVESLAARLRAAGYDVGLSRRIAEDKWLKLCVNLMSAPNAMIRREDHTTPAFVEIKARLLEEAKAALDASGIAARSCDGRDRSLEQEIVHQRESLERGVSSRGLRVYNQVWSALRAGGPLEADAYHRRILDLASARGIPAPMNARVLATLERVALDSLGPESVSAAEILGGT
ncbi:MAG: ketopantoate reductase family protein [Planctomycetota bacterium]|jgi:2-dehydropantoate 2-reductase